MNVVVTGGSGQLGSIVIRRLSADRSVRSITNLDKRPPSVVSPKLKHIEADVRDPEIRRHFEGADAVVHLAALVTQAAGRDTIFSVNVEGSKNVFRAAAASGVKTAVYTSSIAAYGVFKDHPQPIVETTARRYQSSFAYSATKFEVEAFLDDFEPQNPEMSICRLRPGILIGSHMEHALGAALRSRVMPDVGAPPSPLVWDEDVADAVILALKQRARGAFNVVADDSIDARAFADAAGLRYVRIPMAVLKGVTRLPAGLSPVPAADPAWLEVAMAPMVVSSAKARTELGWKPRYGTATDVARRVGEVMPGPLDLRISMFFRALNAAAKRMPPLPEAATMKSRIYINLTGRGGGDIGLIIENGRLRAELGVIPRPPTSVMTMKSTVLLDLLSGKTSYGTAQVTGRVRIEGEPLAGMALSGIIGTFRSQAESSKPQAWPLRKFSQWMGRGRE